jgi:hypothetical protein
MLYVIHLDSPMRQTDTKSARHYIGFVDGSGRLVERMALHRSGRGSRFLNAANEYGIRWRLVAVYRGERTDERRLKNQNNSARICPLCELDPAVNPRAHYSLDKLALGIPAYSCGMQLSRTLLESLRRVGAAHLYGDLRVYTGD